MAIYLIGQLKKSLIEAAGMKYVHAIELYMTENKDNKVRDNYHMIAIAKNWDGVKEINRMVTISNNRKDGHFYYSPRITLDEMESLSENIILTSACLGGPLNDGSDEVKQRVIEYFTKHRDRCFFEIHLNVILITRFNCDCFCKRFYICSLCIRCVSTNHNSCQTHCKHLRSSYFFALFMIVSSLFDFF